MFMGAVRMVCDDKLRLGSLQGNDGADMQCDQHITDSVFFQPERYCTAVVSYA